MADATNSSAIELSESPVEVAKRLIERWLAGFYDGPDLFEQILD